MVSDINCLTHLPLIETHKNEIHQYAADTLSTNRELPTDSLTRRRTVRH